MVLTTDVDWTVRPTPVQADVGSVRDCLASSGFVVDEALGIGNGPGAHYFQDQTSGTQRIASTYLEFLTPKPKPKPKSSPEKPEFREVQLGLRTQTLRYMDLLFISPLDAVKLGFEDGTVDTPFRVPHPFTFILQKILARKKRGDKADKDLAYVFDVALLSRPRWSTFGDVTVALTSDKIWNAWRTSACRTLRDLFATPTSVGPIPVHAQYAAFAPQTAPTERAVARVMQEFLSAVA